jgi:hypothetical protein
MTTTEILTYALAALGSIAAVANAVSLFAPKGTALGDWAAWFASMPLRHKPTKLSGQLARVEAAIEDQKGESK